MSKTRDTGYLNNIIKYTESGNITFVNGNTTLLSISSSGAITTTGVISGSSAESAISASYAQVATSASQAQNAVSSSFATNAANATSASFALNAANAVSASQAQNAVSASQAANANNAVSSSFATTSLTSSFANNLTVAGTITAQTLNVQQVTSSVIYSSGSNVFGNSLANTQVFTGSVSMTGSLRVNGVSTLAGALSGTSATFSSIVGINGVSEEGWGLKVYENLKVQNNNGTTILQLSDTATGGKTWSQISAGAGNVHSVPNGTFYLRNSSDGLTALQVTSTGNLGLGVTPSAWASGWTVLQVGTSALQSIGGFSQLSNNIYYDGSNYRYITSSGAGRIGLNVDGEFFVGTAASGTAGGVATMVTRLSINGSTGAATFSGNSLSLINTGGSADLILGRANTSSGAAINLNTNGVNKWFFGLRGLTNDNFYVYNQSAGLNNLILDAGNGTTTINAIDNSGNRIYPLSVLTIVADNNSNPYNGFGAAIVFKNRIYSGGPSIGGIQDAARIRTNINTNSETALGSDLIFDVTATQNGPLTPAMTLKYNENLLIGTTTDNGYKLRVNGSSYFDGYVQSPGIYGKPYGVTSTSGNTAYIDTGISLENTACYMVTITANPAAAGGVYSYNETGIININSQYNGSSNTQMIKYTRLSISNTSVYPGNLTSTIVFLIGGSEVTQTSSYLPSGQIRIKLEGYANSAGISTYALISRIL